MDIQKLREQAITLVKEKLRNSVSDDQLIVQTISNMEDLDKASNLLSRRLREWYELYNPEPSHAIESHDVFITQILSKSKKELLKELSVSDYMGADLPQKDIDVILNLAEHIQTLFELKKKEEEYLDSLMTTVCPNVKAVAGITIGAKLISLAGSLHRLSKFPASTIQLLGAEKALFRHLRNRKNRPPKFGVLHEHMLVSKVLYKNKGKMARTLGDKISIASKVDHFKGDFCGDTLLKQCEKKAKELSK